MACSIVASHTRGSSTYGLRNEAGDARHRRRSRWPHQHTPGCWFCHILYTFPHICIWQIIYAERIWADGSSSSRNRAAPIAFVLSFYENSVPPRTGGSRDTSSRPAPRAPDAPPRPNRQHAIRRGPRVPPQLPHAPRCQHLHRHPNRRRPNHPQRARACSRSRVWGQHVRCSL